jgi:alkylation response protein AidB-like acyl-CoA dehydrogenase
MLIARETAQLWARKAAALAETWRSREKAETVAYVNLARIAIETAVLDVIRLAQRSLGLAALSAPNPVERLMRDLATYIRQPAADEALTEAAAWHLQDDARLFRHDP